MAERQFPLPGPIVKKSNALARAAWSVKSIYEPRLVALIASRVRKEDKDFQTYEIPIKELIGDSDDGGRSYKLIAEVVDNLMGRLLTIPQPHGWIKYVIFSRCEYDGEKGCIRARFDPDLKEHFLGLKSNFTKYSLVEFLLLPSIYSQRLFELLKSWDDHQEVTIQIDELYKILNVPVSHKSDFAAFRRRVLEKSHRDIHDKTSFNYEWMAVKKGKSVSAVKFIFSESKKAINNIYTQEKESQKNNKLFIQSVACFKSGECTYKSKSKKCILCKKIHSKSKECVEHVL